MNPRHLKDVKRKAIAPYNFVELPNKVVPAQVQCNGELRENYRYHLDRIIGRIECTLTTESPLYIRCGMTTDQFKEAQQQLKEDKENKKEKIDYPEFFYHLQDPKNPMIPGSSLRGMLRNLVEIASFSKIDNDKVSNKEKFFFRAIAAERTDPLSDEYTNQLGRFGRNVKAGYLKQKDDEWSIRPAKLIDNQSFVWIEEQIVLSEISRLIEMKDLGHYKPQYIKNISFDDIYTNNFRKFARKISNERTTYKYLGVLVTSGNMLESVSDTATLKRSNHCIVRMPEPHASLIPIDKQAIIDYKASLTKFQKQSPPFDQNLGVLKNGRVIFYCEPEKGQPVRLFGHSPNFRIPYFPKGKLKAATAVDFIPESLKDRTIIDIADAIFGWVRREDEKNSLPEGIEKSRAGRVFVTDAECISDPNNIWYTNSSVETLIPQILVSPKPTTFQHYLVQTTDVKKDLKHYASEPNTKQGTVIRGHKLYWHKGENPNFKHPDPKPKEDSETQTEIKPIKSGVEFKFNIYFENLTNEELGALLWVLNIAQDEKYRLKLGMGKPLGMGSVKINYTLYKSDRSKRYTTLFSNDQWETAENSITSDETYISAFEKYIIEKIHDADLPEGKTRTDINQINDLPRIESLLAMLSWTDAPANDKTQYMELACNEYKQRHVLPTPLQVRKKEEKRNKPKLISKKDNI